MKGKERAKAILGVLEPGTHYTLYIGPEVRYHCRYIGTVYLNGKDRLACRFDPGSGHSLLVLDPHKKGWSGEPSKEP